MDSRRDGNILVIRLDDGEDLFSSIEGVLSANNVTSGIVLTGIGMLKDFEIGYYEGKEYRKERIEKAHELVALHGSIASTGLAMSLHLHAALADEHQRIIGGHLFGGKVAVVNEITIAVLDNVKLGRTRDEMTGLPLMDFLD